MAGRIDEVKLTKEQKEEILRSAHRDFQKVYDAEYDNKQAFIKNMKFAFNVDNGHWESDDIAIRDGEARPHLTANKMAKFVRQVVNAEKSTPNLDEIIPVDDKGDKYTAQVYNDIIEDIEYRSDGEDVYGTAGEHAVGGGHGYWRILTKYDDDGFDQIIELKKCLDPTLVHKDERGMFAFIRDCVLEDEFEKEWPDREKNDFETDFNEKLWYDGDKIWIAEYFRKEPCKKWIVEYNNPETNETGIFKLNDLDEVPKGFSVLRKRQTDTYKVMWYKITGTDVLDAKEWMGCEIPIIECKGHEIHLEGITYKQSLIEDAKDMNRLYNTFLTSLAEQASMAPKAPYVVTPEQIKGHEGQWKTAFRKLHPYLLYKWTQAGKPQREPSQQIDAGALTMLQIADANIKDVLGMYETSLGEQSNERSSKAITSRKAISDQGTFNFPYNFHKAKLETKRQLIDLIPKVYDNARVMRLRNSDRQIKINYPAIDKNGQDYVLNDLSVGRYDIREKQQMTPSRRQQVVDNLVSAMQYVPTHADLIFQEALKHMDVPGMDTLSESIGKRTQQIDMQNQAKQTGVVQ